MCASMPAAIAATQSVRHRSPVAGYKYNLDSSTKLRDFGALGS
jgi:hypothetical protein